MRREERRGNSQSRRGHAETQLCGGEGILSVEASPVRKGKPGALHGGQVWHAHGLQYVAWKSMHAREKRRPLLGLDRWALAIIGSW